MINDSSLFSKREATEYSRLYIDVFEAQVKMNQGKIYLCCICAFKTTWKYSLARHLKQKHPEFEDKFTFCNICLCLITKEEFELHKNVLHNENKKQKVFSCNFCNYETRWKKSLLKHIEKQHPNEEQSEVKVQCKICSLLFTKTELNLHKKTNHGAIEKHCKFCEFKTFYPQNIQHHVETYHSEFEEEKVECEICSKFYRKRTLNHHQKIMHSPRNNLFCADCSYNSLTLWDLKKHISNYHKFS